MKLKGPILMLLMIGVSLLSAEDYRIVPNYGHLDRVSSMGLDKQRNVLISLGMDSSCLITDLNRKKVINRIDFTGTLTDFCQNPIYPEIAILTYQDDRYTISAYNWQTGHLLFQMQKEEVPYYIDYSQSGNILLYGSTESSLNLVDHLNGSILDDPQSIKSLLTFGYLGGSEKTFMGYNPSGELLYFDRFTSQLKGSAQTYPDLTDIAVLQNDIQLITARQGTNIYLINRQTGEEEDSLNGENIISYHSQAQNGVITLLTEEDENYQLSSYSVKNERFKKISSKIIDETSYPLFSVALDRDFLVGTESGDINLEQKRKKTALFPQRPLKITSLDMGNNHLYMGSEKSIWEWESPFFEEDDQSTNNLLNLIKYQYTSPFEEIHFSHYLNNVILWSDSENRKDPTYVFNRTTQNLDTFSINENPVEEESENNFSFDSKDEKIGGYKSLSYMNNLETLFEWNKVCTVNKIDMDKVITRQEVYSFSHPSLESAAMISENQLVLGRNIFYGGRDCLNITNINTGETIRIDDDRDLVTQIILSEKEDSFYTVGFKKSGILEQCIVRRHDLSNPTIQGETILTIDQSISAECRITLGLNGLIYLITPNGEWYQISDKEQIKSSTISLSPVISHRNYLYTIDKNHSLLISDENNLEPLVRVFFFENGEWLARSLKNNYYFYSRGAKRYFSVFQY